MNILLISQCSKKAREQTCHILDQFAERKGDASWQTAITLEGLETLRRLLRKTARKNTAVACHWIKQSGQNELLWIVGNIGRFNSTGAVPTNKTSRDILRNQHELAWRSAESSAVLAAIAGLFHDFGKSGKLFQLTLNGKGKKRFQPFRHEWISVRLFQAFVGEQSDAQWLVRLGTLTTQDETLMLERLKKDTASWSDSPFLSLPPLGQSIAWLILSHHRLPQYLGENDPSLQAGKNWLTHQLNTLWSAKNHLNSDWCTDDFKWVWTFPHGTPLRSKTWQEKARQLAKRALHAVSVHEFGVLSNTFTVHLARLSLMLSDHHYSASEATQAWQDPTLALWANTDRTTGQLKQKLDEHNVGVAHQALLLGRTLPLLRHQLPAITRHKGFRERATGERFRWQNRAWDLALSLRDASQQQGFFGINMASTGCGKTLANARIMYALAQEQQGCRFTVALGLRTLTLQTGSALKKRLGLGEDDLAVLVGSNAVRELYTESVPDENSRSAEDFFEQHQYVHYDGVVSTGPLRHLFERDNKLSKLINAPVLVATIDHLMPATEGVRGGRQIAPMLRLLTSDLVLDEPDDFDIADQHALCRLVNWTGMLGGRVLLSSATLPPALVQALFAAYCTGRNAWKLACGEPGASLNVCCAWFDEDDACSGEFSVAADFYDAHCRFAQRRAMRLPDKPVLRRAQIASVTSSSADAGSVITAYADTLHHEIINLHNLHHQCDAKGHCISFGLVRMANIVPLVAAAKKLMSTPSPEGYHIHYCIYHSQHPLAIRAYIEQRLDSAFTRHDPQIVWHLPEVKQALRQGEAKHHLFVVLATSVVEVGRDWDADWGMIEPSSMRSLIQFAGRIQRHRQKQPESPNMLILNKNIRALRERSPAYCQPGFESARFLLSSHDLTEILHPDCYQLINAIPRILDSQVACKKNQRFDSLVSLEHARLWEELLGRSEDYPVAAQWWRLPLQWSGELQRRTPFRRSQNESQFFLYMQDDVDEPRFMARDDGAVGWKDPGVFRFYPLEQAKGVWPWIDIDYAKVMRGLAESTNHALSRVSERFGEINLRSNVTAGEVWFWHPLLGVFHALS